MFMKLQDSFHLANEETTRGERGWRAYGVVGDDVPADGEANAGAVAERRGRGARGGALPAQDAGPHRG